MAQIIEGTASLTNNSARVIFTENGDADSQISQVQAGDIFVSQNHQVAYFVGALVSPDESDSGWWEINLSAPYQGDTEQGVIYSLNRDFTANLDLPLVQQGDLHTNVLFSRAMAILDAIVGSLAGDSDASLAARVEVLEARFSYDDGMSKRLTLSFCADAGEIGANQTAVAAFINTKISPNWALFGGDNTYGANFVNDWAAFAALNGVTLPALGNHDDDRGTIDADMAAMFPGLPNNGGQNRYYDKELGNGLVHLFVLHSGLKTNGTSSEPHGNTVGSTQYNWFVAKIAASKARWKIVMFHHPFMTSNSDTTHRADAMNWGFENLGVDLVLTGHAHLWEMFTHNGLSFVCGGGTTFHSASVSDLTIHTAITVPGRTTLDWVLEARPCVAKLVATKQNLRVEVWDVLSNAMVKAVNVGEFDNELDVWSEVVLPPGYEDLSIVYPSTLYVGTIERSFVLDQGIAVSLSVPYEYEATTTLRVHAKDKAGVDLGVVTDYILTAGKTYYRIPLEECDLSKFKEGTQISVSLAFTPDPYFQVPVNGLTLALLGRYIS